MTVPLVLASGSPRRRDYLSSLGLAFDVVPSLVDEGTLKASEPHTLARGLAEMKALDVGQRRAFVRTDTVVLGADTVVVCDQRVLGKPEGFDDACRMLRQLSGRWHEVVTGVALVVGGQCVVSFCVETRVHFVNLSAPSIANYVRTGEPMDKAGAYGIQGGAAAWVDRIEGSYTNVVGLPLAEVCEQLQVFGAIEVA